MAYITKVEVQEMKQKLKVLLDSYGIKFTIKGSNSSTVTVILREYDDKKNKKETLDFGWLFDKERNKGWVGHTDINRYWYETNFDDPAMKSFFKQIFAIMLEKHWDESDSMTDYFHCAYYADLKIGVWDKAFKIVES